MEVANGVVELDAIEAVDGVEFGDDALPDFGSGSFKGEYSGADSLVVAG